MIVPAYKTVVYIVVLGAFFPFVLASMSIDAVLTVAMFYVYTHIYGALPSMDMVPPCKDFNNQ
jgi:hypothetical protein